MRPGFGPETPFIVDTLFIILMTIASQSSTAVRKILIKRSDILFIIPILYGGHGKQIERRLHFLGHGAVNCSGAMALKGLKADSL